MINIFLLFGSPIRNKMTFSGWKPRPTISYIGLQRLCSFLSSSLDQHFIIICISLFHLRYHSTLSAVSLQLMFNFARDVHHVHDGCGRFSVGLLDLVLFIIKINCNLRICGYVVTTSYIRKIMDNMYPATTGESPIESIAIFVAIVLYDNIIYYNTVQIKSDRTYRNK